MLYDPERRWARRAICDWDQDHRYFFADGGTAGRTSLKVQAAWDRAKEICAMCPVLAECRRDTMGEDFGVWGGLDQNERAAVRRALSKAAKKWPEGRRLAWGKAVQALRDGGVNWREITLMTGLPHPLAENLATQWRVHLIELESRPKVVDLPLPDDRPRGPEFPVKPGGRHAWVRHNRRISDAIYRGETPTGAWVFVTVYSGHGHVNKWVRRRDVQIYHPQPVIIMSKRKEEADEPEPAPEPHVAQCA